MYKILNLESLRLSVSNTLYRYYTYHDDKSISELEDYMKTYERFNLTTEDLPSIIAIKNILYDERLSMRKINDIHELNKIIFRRWSELDSIDYKYLNEEGRAAMEAYHTVLWYTSFHDTIESFRGDQKFRELLDISGRNPEYYKILRKVIRSLEEK